MTAPGSPGSTARTASPWGSLKMDFLGLRNLTVIGDAVNNIKANRGIDLDMLKVPLDDAAAYRAAGRRETLSGCSSSTAP